MEYLTEIYNWAYGKIQSWGYWPIPAVMFLLMLHRISKARNIGNDIADNLYVDDKITEFERQHLFMLNEIKYHLEEIVLILILGVIALFILYWS